MGSFPSSLDVLAQEWLTLDKDEHTRKVISDLVAARDVEGLRSRLVGRIGFGTAGLRSRMDAGYTRMNCVTVAQTSMGLAAYLIAADTCELDYTVISGLDETAVPPPPLPLPPFDSLPDIATLSSVPVMQRGVVIGRDARTNSDRFAILTALAFISHGFRVWWYPDPIHTPLVPFAVRALGAAAGVMITASHNPKDDNGYKVYWNNGCQIITPHDSGISKAIVDALGERLAWESDVPANKADSPHCLLRHSYVTRCDDLVRDNYIEQVTKLVGEQAPLSSDLRFVYTPMHGTGLEIMQKVLERNKILDTMTVVPEQAYPDPTFRTVSFPNPEETGALDLAIETANKHNLDLILASDPDADRLAVALRLHWGESGEEQEWHQFTGNEIGVLLAAHMIETTPNPEQSLALLASTVSSQMVTKMAAEEGIRYHNTLTGFKWIGNTALDVLADPAGAITTVFGYEEALGYMFTGVVPDKDSISAALVFLSAISRWKTLHEQGDRMGASSAYDKLQQLRERYGYFAEANTYVTTPSVEVTEKTFTFIRLLGNMEALELSAEPVHEQVIYPRKVGRFRMLRWWDVTNGYDSDAAGPEHRSTLPLSLDSEMISCELSSLWEDDECDGESLERDIRFTIRASGTEPKIKLYIEARSGENMEEAQRLAEEVQKCVVEEWLGQI